MSQTDSEELREKLVVKICYILDAWTGNDPSYLIGRSVDRQLIPIIQAYTAKKVLEGRLIELDLLEQALNSGWDMNKYKRYRLTSLTSGQNDE